MRQESLSGICFLQTLPNGACRAQQCRRTERLLGLPKIERPHTFMMNMHYLNFQVAVHPPAFGAVEAVLGGGERWGASIQIVSLAPFRASAMKLLTPRW